MIRFGEKTLPSNPGTAFPDEPPGISKSTLLPDRSAKMGDPLSKHTAIFQLRQKQRKKSKSKSTGTFVPVCQKWSMTGVWNVFLAQ